VDLSETTPETFGGRRHPWEVTRRRVVRDLFSKTPPARCILDIGCGDAFLLEGLAEWEIGTSYIGIDPALIGSAAGFMGFGQWLIAGVTGAAIPIFLERKGVDPALASSVFLTTVTDVVGFFVFLGLGAMILL